MENQVIQLLQSENFLSRLNDASDNEEIVSIFEKEGVKISLDKAEIISQALQNVNHRIYNNEKLDLEELEKISGGGLPIIKSLELLMLSAVIA